jgi:hypothetical protein
MVGTKSQGKTKAFTSKEGIPPMVAIQKNRTEAYVLNPDLANVASVTIVSNSPKEVALIRKNIEKAFENNGSALPKVKVVSAESGASGNVGRKAITDEYFKLTGEQRYMPAGDMATGRGVKDNSGNVIPLSQRFKATSEDIRFMPASDQDTKALQMLPKPRRSLDAAYRDGVKTRSQDPQYYDVPDYVGYDMARTAAFEMGREGAEPPRWVMAERIGKLPTEGRSKNFAEDRMERGVSVLRIVGEPQSDVGTYEMFNPGEKRYVAGWLVGLGSDGEPLLADAVDLGPASSDVRMMPSPDSAMPGAYSFPGGYRAIPGKAKGSLRLYGPAGSLIGIAASLDEAQRIIRKKSKQ